MVDVKFKHANGRVQRLRRASPVQTRRGAERYERELRDSLLDGTFGKKVEEVPTVAEFVERFLLYSENNNKPSYHYAKKGLLTNHLLPVFGKRRMDQITFDDIEEYKAKKVKEGYDKKTVNNHLAVLRPLLNEAAVKYREIHVPRFRLYKTEPSPFEFLDFDEAERFMDVIPPQWTTMCLVALRTGLRIGEMLALKRSDLDLGAGRLIVRHTRWNGVEYLPKGGRGREVPLSDDAIDALKAHRHLRGSYVFCHEDGSPLSHSECKDVVPFACSKAGLAKRLTFHGLRHTFASHLAMRGVPLKTIQELLGHATMDMTMRYAHLSPDVKRDAVKLLDAVRPRGHGGATES
jgi:integrase